VTGTEREDVTTMNCESKDLIVGYLYDELTNEEKRTFDAHLAVCAECSEDVSGLRATRAHMSLWSPPEPEFNFRIIREPVAPATVLPMRSRWTGRFALAAAAVLVLAAATAVANLEVRYDTSGLLVRTGWGARGDATGAPSAAVPVSASNDFQALEQRLRNLEIATASPPSAAGVQTASARMSDAEILRRVREIVGDAESRQQTAVAQRLLQVVRDFDRQREADLALIQRGLGQYQGLTNAEIAQQRDMLNELYRVAARQDK
jgi:hypothetical protein